MQTGRTIYRIKSKSRFTVFIVLLMITFVSMSNMVLGLSDVSSLTQPIYADVQINSGDTLWDIASEYNPSNTDVRELVYEICRLNGISADTIYPGQTIRVPVLN